MKVKDLLERKKNKSIWTIGPDRKVLDAVKSLCENRIGALIVEDEQKRPIGIITERDILFVLNQKEHQITEVIVSDVMTKDVICAVPDDDMNYVMNIMTNNNIRHLPIVDHEQIAGLISMRDVVDCQIEKMKAENHMLQDYLHLTGQI